MSHALGLAASHAVEAAVSIATDGANGFVPFPLFSLFPDAWEKWMVMQWQ